MNEHKTRSAENRRVTRTSFGSTQYVSSMCCLVQDDPLDGYGPRPGTTVERDSSGVKGSHVAYSALQARVVPGRPVARVFEEAPTGLTLMPMIRIAGSAQFKTGPGITARGVSMVIFLAARTHPRTG